MQSLRVASSFCRNCMSAFMTARACVGTAIIIDFAKQVEIVCLPGRGVYRNWKQCRSRPSPDCSARTFAVANCPLRTPLNCVFFDCREYGWQNQSGANNGNLFRYGRFSPWHFWVDHGFVVFGPNNSHFLRCKQTSITISAILILLSYLHVWSTYTQNGYRWKRYLRICVLHRIKLAWSEILKTSKYRFSMGIHTSKNRLWRNTGRSKIRLCWVPSSTVSRIFRS